MMKKKLTEINKHEKKKELEMESKSLMKYLKGLNDPRKEKGKRHEQELIIIVCLMMGCKSMREISCYSHRHEWLHSRLKLH
jgi:hypothetical protein